MVSAGSQPLRDIALVLACPSLSVQELRQHQAAAASDRWAHQAAQLDGPSWLCAGLVLACLPPLLGSFQVFSRINKRNIREGLSASAAATVVSEESLSSLRTVLPACWCFECTRPALSPYAVLVCAAASAGCFLSRLPQAPVQ